VRKAADVVAIRLGAWAGVRAAGHTTIADADAIRIADLIARCGTRISSFSTGRGVSQIRSFTARGFRVSQISRDADHANQHPTGRGSRGSKISRDADRADQNVADHEFVENAVLACHCSHRLIRVIRVP
jgi:hypothetical protein